MHKKFIPLIILLFSSFGSSQAKSLTFERGGISDSPGIVEKGDLHMELGLMTYERSFESSKDYGYNLGSTLFRYGLIQDRLELRLTGSGLSLSESGASYTSIVPGFKIAILEEKKILPSLQLISGFNIPLVSELGDDIRSGAGEASGFESNYSHFYKLLINKSLTSKISFLANLSLNFDSFDFVSGREYTSSSVPYVFNLGYAATDKLSLFTEIFGSWSLSNELGSPMGISYGLTYLVNDDLALDFTNYYGLNDVTPDFGITTGLSYRF